MLNSLCIIRIYIYIFFFFDFFKFKETSLNNIVSVSFFSEEIICICGGGGFSDINVKHYSRKTKLLVLNLELRIFNIFEPP